MQITFKKNDLKFLGKESKTSKKGNDYEIISFMDGASTHTLLSKTLVPDYSFGDVFNANFSVDYGVKFPGVCLVSFE